MAVVVIIALLSAGYSVLYACSRLMYSMAEMNQLPSAFSKTTERGVPMLSLVISLAAGLMCLVSSVVSPGAVYLALVSIAGFAVVAVWIVIVVAQMMNRRKFVAAGGDIDKLAYKTPMYPWVPIIALVACVISLIAVAFDPNQVAALLFGIPFEVICYGIHKVVIEKLVREDSFVSG